MTNHFDLDQQIQLAQARLVQIRQQADLPARDRESLLVEAISELSISLEELHVATEELQQQNDELRATRQDLDCERQRYQGLFDFAPDAYLVTDGNGIIQAANCAAQTLFNVRRDWLVGKPLSIFFTAENSIYLHSQLEQIQTVSAQPETLYFVQDRELSLQPRDSEPLPVSLSLSGEYDRQGALVQLCWLFHDLRERKLAEQKIREQAALIDIATDAISVQDLENRTIFWSQGAERLYGWTAAEALGKKISELIYKDLHSAELAIATHDTLEQGSWQGELENISKTGKTIKVASRWTLVRDESGKPKSILVVSSDITEKKKLEQQFYRAQRLDILGILAGGIAHDLNNIFTPILVISQLLPVKSKNMDAQTQKLFKILEASAKRGVSLVKQILVFSRGSEGKLVVLQVGNLIEEVEAIAQQTFPKSIEIQTKFSTRTLWLTKADPTQLHQVLMNLVVNARDAMPNGGLIEISAENRLIDKISAAMNPDAHEGKYVCITFSDTGVGISPDNLDLIFEPFFTTKVVEKGTGLGLFTVLRIVKNHGGFLQVFSKVSKGTQFQVYLPAIEKNVIKSTQETKLLRGNGELILIVDDEAAVRQITTTSLEEYHYKVLPAKDGIEAISVYAQHQNTIRIVFLDMMMPNMDGLMAIRTLCAMNPQVKILATSGLLNQRQLAFAAGAKTFLSKPYTIQELLQTVSELLATN
jgi:two-component system, cell cycle sensor histidine kinase and response regulator CckA